MAINEKRPKKLSDGIAYLHDNAPAHGSRMIQYLLKDFKWDVFPHPAYSLDMAASDFHLFTNLHVWLGGKDFRTMRR